MEQKDFDFNRLDDFAKSVFLTIKRLFPEWLKDVKHSSEWWEERFDIEWTSPCKGVPEIWVSTGRGDTYDLQVGFGGAHIHMAYDHSELKTIESWILKANEYLELLRAEKLIYFKSRWTVSLKKTSELESLLKKKGLRKIYSWLGTYNYSRF